MWRKWIAGTHTCKQDRLKLLSWAEPKITNLVQQTGVDVAKVGAVSEIVQVLDTIQYDFIE